MANDTQDLSPGLNRLIKRARDAKRRRVKVLALYEAGNSLARVGEMLGGISKQRVAQMVKQAKDERGQ